MGLIVYPGEDRPAGWFVLAFVLGPGAVPGVPAYVRRVFLFQGHLGV